LSKTSPAYPYAEVPSVLSDCRLTLIKTYANHVIAPRGASDFDDLPSEASVRECLLNPFTAFLALQDGESFCGSCCDFYGATFHLVVSSAREPQQFRERLPSINASLSDT
jgi:hypothetical protein